MISEIYYEPENPSTHHLEMFEDQAMKISVSADMWATREGSSLSSAVWSVESGGSTVGSDTEASNVSTALVTADLGETQIKVTLTLADGQIGIQWIRITVREIDRAVTRY